MNKFGKWLLSLSTVALAGASYAEGGATLDFSSAATDAAAGVGPAATAGLVVLAALLAVSIAVKAFKRTAKSPGAGHHFTWCSALFFRLEVRYGRIC